MAFFKHLSTPKTKHVFIHLDLDDTPKSVIEPEPEPEYRLGREAFAFFNGGAHT
jgi:hypothetical protein